MNLSNFSQFSYLQRKLNNFPSHYKSLISVLLALLIILYAWLGNGFDWLEFDSDWGRDLKEISNIQDGRVVWLGPWLNPGFHASSAYYYLFFPVIEFSNGNPYSMVYLNIILGVLGLSILAFSLCKKQYRNVFFILLAIGLSPFFFESTLHPGNGFTIVPLTLIGLSLMYFNWPIWLSAMAVGLATSFHPATFVMVPLFGFQLYQNRRQYFLIILSLGLFLIPWLPLIAYEVITKGFLLRNFLEQPSSGLLVFGPSFDNLRIIARAGSVNILVFVGLLGGSWYLGGPKINQRKFWYVTALFGLLAAAQFSALPPRYLYPLILLILFLVCISLSKTFVGRLILLGYTFVVFLQSPLLTPPISAERPISQVVSYVDFFEQEYRELKSSPIALVAATSPETPVPQADDYRALLRNRGFEVVDVTQQTQAEYLVLFIEVKNFDWANWSNWEISSFGERELVDQKEFGVLRVVVYGK